MAYCGPRGIPLSEFLQWHPDDQQAALAWQAEENLKCPHCGTAEWEWEEDDRAYTAVIDVCRGCGRVHNEAERAEKTKIPGVKVRLVPREVVERDLAH